MMLLGWELVNGSQGWKLWLSPSSRDPALLVGMHGKVRTKRKYSFNWVSQISPQPLRSKAKSSKGKKKKPKACGGDKITVNKLPGALPEAHSLCRLTCRSINWSLTLVARTECQNERDPDSKKAQHCSDLWQQP